MSLIADTFNWPRSSMRRPSRVPLPWRAAVVLLWLGLLVYLALIPRPPLLPGISEHLSSQIAHAAVQAGLGFLLFLWIVPAANRGRTRVAAAIAAAFVSFLFAGATEVAQHFWPDRAAEVEDAVIGALGASAGAAVGLALSYTELPWIFQWKLAAAFVVASLLATTLAMVAWDPSLPRVGDHWHASYSITICGQKGGLPAGQGGVHTHGDGVIHIHPFTEAEAGRNATMALMFASSGAELGDDYVISPAGERYANDEANDDLCPDGNAGRLTMTVNGTDVAAPASYVPRNRDVIRIDFS